MKLDTKNLTITLSFNTLIKLLKNAELFKELIDSNQLNEEDLKYLLNRIDTYDELDNLTENTILLKHIVDKNILSFKELVDKYKNIENGFNNSCLQYLLSNKEIFNDLVLSNKLNKEDLRYLLNTIDNDLDLDSLCTNTSLIKHILNEFVLDKETVDKFNTIIENTSWCEVNSEVNNIHNIFKLIEFYATHEWDDEEEEYCRKSRIDQELLELLELNKKVYLLSTFDLNLNQKLDLSEVLKDNEITKNKLIQIVENNLESNYDFDSLMQYLKKKEKKNLINI